MFKSKLKNIREFKTIVNGISRLVDEITIKIDSDGLFAKAIDRSHISFIGLKIGRNFFEEYEIDKPGELSINLDELLNILNRYRGEDILNLYSDDNILSLEFEGEGKRNFEIKQVESNYASSRRPSVDFSIVDLKIPFNFFKNTIGDLDLVANKFRLRINDYKVIFDCKGTFSNIKSEFHHNSPGMGIVNGNFYSLNFINSFLCIDKVSNTVLLSTGEDLPLFLKLTNDDVIVDFLLAPRLESS